MSPHKTDKSLDVHAYTSADAIADEERYSAHNYVPLPVVFARAQGVNVWDPEDKHYYDFLSGYGVVNQGHFHPELVKALVNRLVD